MELHKTKFNKSGTSKLYVVYINLILLVTDLE